MKVSELCIVMLTTGCTRIECEGEEFNTIFEFNDKYGNRTIRSVQRKVTFGNTEVLIKVELEDEDWILDALERDEGVGDE